MQLRDYMVQAIQNMATHQEKEEELEEEDADVAEDETSASSTRSFPPSLVRPLTEWHPKQKLKGFLSGGQRVVEVAKHADFAGSLTDLHFQALQATPSLETDGPFSFAHSKLERRCPETRTV